jgi:3',5'-cyclic AMP phosphodiesterase CpdA
MPRSPGVGWPTSALAVAAVLVIAGCGTGETAISLSPTTEAGYAIPSSHDLAVLGDWGSDGAAQDRVASTLRAKSRELEFGAIVTTGDNLYTDNARELMEPYEWALDREIPFLVTWGNHDIETEKRVEVVNETFGGPPRWALHEWGDIDLLILDSNQIHSLEQIDFLTRTLQSSDDPTIVVFHHPPFSCGSHGDTQAVIDTWVARFDEDVFLVISGHEHNYQRFDVDDVTYLVTGGGGRSITELRDCPGDHPDRIAGEAIYHFVTLEQLGEELSLTAVSANGAVIERVSLALP